MKTLTTFLFFSILFLNLSSQELMTIGEVFDFEIGDEFQIEGHATGQPPNADRITIIGKEYSSGNDTLFYHRYHDSYRIILEGDTGYHYFYTKTDTVFYTHLDSSIAFYDEGFQLDQYFDNPDYLCGELVNGCSYDIGPGMDRDHATREYGLGLGRTYAFYFNGLSNTVDYDDRLFYYKKGDFECGTPDLTTVGIDDIENGETKFTIFPNPATSVIYIRNTSQSSCFEYRILDCKGQQIDASMLEGELNGVDVSDLKEGIYFLQILSIGNLISMKFIKE